MNKRKNIKKNYDCYHYFNNLFHFSKYIKIIQEQIKYIKCCNKLADKKSSEMNLLKLYYNSKNSNKELRNYSLIIKYLKMLKKKLPYQEDNKENRDLTKMNGKVETYYDNKFNDYDEEQEKGRTQHTRGRKLVREKSSKKVIKKKNLYDSSNSKNSKINFPKNRSSCKSKNKSKFNIFNISTIC
jgi:hypothetical protein